MKLTGLLAWATTAAAWAFPAGGAGWMNSDLARRADDIQQLNQRLSRGAMIYLPGTDGFKEATTRWSVLSTPKPTIVVVPTTANDIAETVCSSNGMRRVVYGH